MTAQDTRNQSGIIGSNLLRREMLSTLIGTFAGLSLPAASTSLLAQEPKTEISLRQVGLIAKKSSVCLILNQERSIGLGSGTFIEAPDSIRPLLHPDEVLVASVSHNFSDWSSRCFVVAGRFKEIAPNGAGSNEERYHARLIQRFVATGGNEPVLTKLVSSLNCFDISLVAVRIPAQVRAEVDKLLLPIAPKGYKLNQSQEVVGVGFGSRGSGPQEELKPMVKLPKCEYREGRVIGIRSETMETQFGKSVQSTIHTTVSNVPGESGGGLFVWDDSLKRPILVGLCSTGRTVPLKTADFDAFLPPAPLWIGIEPGGSTENLPEGAIIYRSKEEFEKLQYNFRAKNLGWVFDSTERGSFAHIDGIYDLADESIRCYSTLLEERSKIVQARDNLMGELRARTILKKNERRLEEEVRLLADGALEKIDMELGALKPPR